MREIFRIIDTLRASGVSILLVEQNARAALEVADYGYVLETGELRLEGPASELPAQGGLPALNFERAGIVRFRHEACRTVDEVKYLADHPRLWKATKWILGILVLLLVGFFYGYVPWFLTGITTTRRFHFRDPFGNNVELIERTGS